MAAARPLRVAAAAMTALLVLSVLAGLLLPIYTDEVGWRFQLSRWFQDGGVDRFIAENCGANTVARAPLFMLPVRWFSSAVGRLLPDPGWVRVFGVANALLALLALRALIGRVAPDPARRSALIALACALLGWGVLPLLLVLNRPEQPILLALLAGLLVALAPAPAGRSPVWRVSAVLALALVAMSYHLKALFYLPVFAGMLWLVTRGAASIWWRVGALALLAAAALVAFDYWSGRFACPADAVLRAKLERENASVLLLDHGWSGVADSLPALLRAASPVLYIFAATPAQQAMSDWLPPNVVPAALVGPWRTLGKLVWYGALALCALELLRSGGRFRRRDGFVLALALLCCATAWAALQLSKNAYESALYLPALAIAVILVLAAVPTLSRATIAAGAALCLVSAVSQAGVLASHVPRLWRTAARGGYLADQPYSLRAWRYGQARRAILRAGARCGIGEHSPRLLVDDLTYCTYGESYRPFHRLGVLSDWQGSIGDPAAWLRARGSSGAVLACGYLPPAMRAQAIASGDLCCWRP